MNLKERRKFFEALEYIALEKGVSLCDLIEKLKNAIFLAVKKQYGGVENIVVEIDAASSKFEIAFFRRVVSVVKDPANEITLEDALIHSKKAKLNELVEIKLDSKQFGRFAAQAAKQQIVQGIRDIEKKNVTEKLEDRVGKLVSAPVELLDIKTGNVILKIDGDMVILFKNDQILGEKLLVGDIVKVYAVDMADQGSKRLLKISRTHPNFVAELFKLEVPEIAQGIVKIKCVAREAGFRSKIAVESSNEEIEPVGCCIGDKGVRIEAIVSELNGEKVDVIKFSNKPEEFVAAALAPARVLKVKILKVDEKEKFAFVLVDRNQVSLAIGGHGLNVKLAANLTGYKIEVCSNNNDGAVDENILLERINRKKEQLQLKTQDQDVLFEQFKNKTEEEIEEEKLLLSYEIEEMLDNYV